MSEQDSTLRQIAFHQQEIAEGPSRGMPEVQIETHRAELRLHLGALGVSELPAREEPEDLIA